VVVFREVITQLDTVKIPTRSCDYGYLESGSYSQVVVKFHCTTDLTEAVVEDCGPVPS
jgi:hypothetical protein